jgi:lipoprotein-anchoring transpeptidase ErfK/SrfK
MRNIVPVLLALALAGCGSHRASQAPAARAPAAHVPVAQVRAVQAQRCAPARRVLGSSRRSYMGVAQKGATAFRSPGGAVVARFGPKNVNGYPTVFGILGVVRGRDCSARWYHVQLPMKPNGATGYVRATALEIQSVAARIEVDVSARKLTLFRAGRPVLRAAVAVGSPSTPTPIGRYYVNQRLIPTDTRGPFGPGAIGVSAFSTVLTGWAQGGPVAIHGTNEPWSIGHAVSNGCIRLPNATLQKVFAAAVAGTPVIIHP